MSGEGRPESGDLAPVLGEVTHGVYEDTAWIRAPNRVEVDRPRMTT